MRQTLLVGLAGMLGTLARYWLAGRVAARHGEAFPWGTLAVNVAGCFLAGVLLHLTHERLLFGEPWRTARPDGGTIRGGCVDGELCD